ncbi:hypothetical protein PRZ48_010260 [Zasmidium cellare]|uniref:Uncharacterized protein n=1 Tax=Zasmidium cellare TaxID=395010 RepID=A0ABR0E849_ZASCE|nr:hypothetical protein PRZ48_010260 [Zasmidium cellare]
MANHLAAPPTGVKIVKPINAIAGVVQILHVVDNRINENGMMELETYDIKEIRNTLLLAMCASLKVAKMCPIAKVVGQDFAVQLGAVVDADDNVF